MGRGRGTAESISLGSEMEVVSFFFEDGCNWLNLVFKGKKKASGYRCDRVWEGSELDD